MKKILLAFFCFILLQGTSYACGGLNVPAYSGEIRYSFGGPGSTNPLNCSIVVTMYFDVDDGLENDSILIYWGDGKFGIIYGVEIAQDTTKYTGFVGMKPLYKHVYEGEHQYDSIPASGYCSISVAEQYRLNYTSNVGNGLTSNVPFYIMASAFMDTSSDYSNRSPLMHPPTVSFGSASSSFYMNPMVEPDLDGDSLVFEIVPPLQDPSTFVAGYRYPSDFCNTYNPGTSTYTINPHTGEVTWAAPCYQGIFAITTIVKKYRDGRMMGSMLRDQNIYVGAKVVTSIGDNAEENSGIRIFNNPVDNMLSGSINNLSSTVAFANILSVEGRLMAKNLELVGTSFDIDVSYLPSGLYFLSINNGGQSYTRKFTKF